MGNETPARVVGYCVVFPVIPEGTVENNCFMYNIAKNEDWPKLATAEPKKMYEGTVRMLMDYGATVMEHLEHLATLPAEERKFETVVDPLLTEEYDVNMAFQTLVLKMLTDWPDCNRKLFDADLHHEPPTLVVFGIREGNRVRLDRNTLRAMVGATFDPSVTLKHVGDNCNISFKNNTALAKAADALKDSDLRFETFPESEATEKLKGSDPADAPNIRLHDKVWIPQGQFPDLNFVGLLIGPRGNTLKSLEAETGAKIIIRGNGSTKEGKLTNRMGPMPGENEPLHAYVTGTDMTVIKKACDKIRQVLQSVTQTEFERKRQAGEDRNREIYKEKLHREKCQIEKEIELKNAMLRKQHEESLLQESQRIVSYGGVPSDELYTAIYDFEAVEPTDLALSVGDTILVLEKNDEWWKGRCNGKEGIFPANYVEKQEQHEAPPPSSQLITRPQVICEAKVIVDFTALAPNQLGIKVGETVKVREKSAAGWWEGELVRDGRPVAGWFPGDCVKIIETTTPTTPKATQAIALYDYDASQPDELSFKTGDNIVITDKTDFKFWKGYKITGPSKTGLFPSNYVKIEG